MCYLCNEYANGLKKDLYPSAPAARAKVDQMLYVGEAFEAVTMQQYPVSILNPYLNIYDASWNEFSMLPNVKVP